MFGIRYCIYTSASICGFIVWIYKGWIRSSLIKVIKFILDKILLLYNKYKAFNKYYEDKYGEYNPTLKSNRPLEASVNIFGFFNLSNNNSISKMKTLNIFSKSNSILNVNTCNNFSKSSKTSIIKTYNLFKGFSTKITTC